MINRFYRIVFAIVSLNIVLMAWWKVRHSIAYTETRFTLATQDKNHLGIIERLNRNVEQGPLISHLQSVDQTSHVLCNTQQHSNRKTHTLQDSHDNTFYDNTTTNSTYHLPKRPFSPLSDQAADGVQRFVFFVGYARSGHSIIASMIDAHPNMIVAHEYRLFHKLSMSKVDLTNRTDLFNQLYKNSYTNAVNGWRSEFKAQKGYTLAVDGWQGAFSTLQVIGDKSGGTTSQLFKNSPPLFISALKQLRNIVSIPVRVIHVVRNPYDMISTRLLYTDARFSNSKLKSKVSALETCKHSNITGLQNQINRTFHIIENVQEIFDVSNLTVLDVHLVDFIKDPKRVLKMICTFLNVECHHAYIESCVSKVYKEQSKTRRLVEWPKEMIEEVEERAKPYRFLWRYSFTGD